MNFQKKPPKEISDLLVKDDRIEFSELSFFCWPQNFSSTSGPCGGAGGQSISSFTVEVWVADNGMAIYLCNGMYSIDKWEPFKIIKEWKKL